MAMNAAPTSSRSAWAPAARSSSFSWPYRWEASAGASDLRTDAHAIRDAIRSMSEWTASLRIPTEPVIRPAASFKTIRHELETIETAAARVLAGEERSVTPLMMPQKGIDMPEPGAAGGEPVRPRWDRPPGPR